MDIHSLLIGAEGKTLEFKRNTSSHGPILKTACAFANTAGGTLVFGVADDTSVIGIDDALSAEETIASVLTDGISPRLLPEIEIHAWRDKSLVLVTVHPGPSRPYHVTSLGEERGIFVRVGSTNRLADDGIVAELARTTALSSFDEQPFPAVTPGGIDLPRLVRHFEGVRRIGQRDLRSLRLTCDYQRREVATVGGVLLAGYDRDVHFPYAHVRMGKFAGDDRRTILDSRETDAGAGLIDAVDATMDWIGDRTLRSLHVSGTRNDVRWQYPMEAVREAVINAVVHADYSQLSGPIRVSLYDRRLEIENPGMLPFGLTIDEMLAGASRVRNRAIARVFRELGLIEQWGSGVARMLDACKGAGLPAPKFEEVAFGFRVTLFADAEGVPEVDALDARMLDALQSRGELRTSDIAEEIGRTPRSTRTRLGRLVDRGLVVEVGSGPNDPNRTYHIAEERAEYRVRE